MQIIQEDLKGAKIIKLLEEHVEYMIKVTPPGCVHALDLDALRRPEITFWSVWDADELLGCGALKELDSKYAELKSMRTANVHQGKGVASYLLDFILSEAKHRGYDRISLETGASDAFEPARRLYEKFGFTYCGSFAGYEDGENNVFMTYVV